MARTVYIGDEATAAGFRLAGVQAWVPDPADALATLRRASADGAELILLSAPFAALLPVDELVAALERETPPLVAVVPDVFGCGTPPDLAHEVRGALGIES
jgi:vacuolar-type H+-ATPase subunit F/Vma7